MTTPQPEGPRQPAPPHFPGGPSRPSPLPPGATVWSHHEPRERGPYPSFGGPSAAAIAPTAGATQASTSLNGRDTWFDSVPQLPFTSPSACWMVNPTRVAASPSAATCSPVFMRPPPLPAVRMG